MAFRFQKRLKIAPGLRVNISKTGVSTSIGKPGATVNVGKQGVKGTVGVLGTGLSYRKTFAPSDTARSDGSAQPRSGKGSWIAAGLVVILALAALAYLLT